MVELWRGEGAPLPNVETMTLDGRFYALLYYSGSGHAHGFAV